MDPKAKADDQKFAAHAAAVAANPKPAAVEPKAEPKAEKPKTFAGKIDDLDHRLGVAVAFRNGEWLGKLYDEFDALKPSNPTEETQREAFARRLAHFAPRKLAKVKEIEATLDGDVAGKAKAEAPPEHPAVTRAKESLAALDAEHAGNIPIPQDEEALAALADKMAKVKPQAD